MVPTHHDLAVILAVIFAFGIGGLIFLGWLVWSSSRRSQHLTRAVGALIVQEADKIRALVRDTR